jgi:exodeoxyribonuclease V alpha subunit
MVAETSQISAVVQSIRWQDSASGWTIAEMAPSSPEAPSSVQVKSFTAVGSLGSIKKNERVVLHGEWVIHDKYGPQLQVSGIELPDYKAGGIKEFLNSGYLKGVGPSLAQKIYEHFGEETAKIFEDDPDRLCEVKGIGQKKLVEIMDCWNEHQGKREILAAFSSFQIGPRTVQKILDRWKNPRDAMKVLNENPYLLAWEIHGVGFSKADEIAKNKGFTPKHPHRVKAAIAYVLDEAAKGQGHCFLYREQLFTRVNGLLNPHAPDKTAYSSEDLALIEDNLQSLLFNQKVVEESDGRIYLFPVFRAERAVEQNCRQLLSPLPSSNDAQAALHAFQQQNGIRLHEQQAEAVLKAHRSRLHVITGGPGTGKTTIIKALLATLDEGISVALAAPTGRAAKRMSESTGSASKTIHRLLEFSPQNGGWGHNKENPLDADLVIVDEASMLDIFLAKALTDALKPESRLILIGDVDQLPSVSAGSVLQDLLASPDISRTRLTEIFRQSPNSFISLNANAVIRGKFQEINLSNKTEDFFWLGIDPWCCEETTSAQKCQLIKHRVCKVIERLFELGYKKEDIQILSSTKKGEVGINSLNSMLQEIFNKGGKTYKIGFNNFAIGDRVMQQRNNYDKEVFNGDQGYIQKIDTEESKLFVTFDGRIVEYEFKNADELTLAYAITVHKSQGSESPIIIHPVTMSQYVMLQRNLLYTGITRAKSRCILVGEIAALKRAVRNRASTQRNTSLLTPHS